METCRLCLNRDEIQITIFNNNEVQDLSTIINELVSIKISTEDKLTTSICRLCMNKIMQWKLFKTSCHESNEILLEAYQQRNRSKDSFEFRSLVDNDLGLQMNKILSSADEIYTVSSKLKNRTDADGIKTDGYEFEELLEETFFDNEFKLDTNNIYKCDICLVAYHDCIEYLDHQESHNGSLVFKCSKCTDIFITRKELVNHENNHQTPCHQCSKMILKSSMKLHLIRHTDRHKCKDCSGRFNSKAGLVQHIITVHTDIKDHICETCGKRFSSQTAMRVHMKSHSDERLYQCKLCTYAGRTASALYIHMSTHANDLCVCEVCSKTFKSTRNLNDHLRRVHCKDKKHECTYCNKRFVDQYMLRVHMRCHTGVRPYKCNKCEKSFIRSDGLKDHMSTHEQRVLYDCSKCGKRFTSKRGVTRHACAGSILSII